MSERIALDGVEPNQFDQLIDLLVGWIADNVVRVAIKPPTRISLNYDSDSLVAELKDHDLPESIVTQLESDIPLMLSGILSGNRNTATRFLIGHEHQDEASDSEVENKRNEVSIRIQLVEEKVASAEIRRQFSIKRNAKSNVLTETSWEVSEKRSEDHGVPLSNLTYATLRIEAQTPPTSLDRELDIPFSINIFNPPKMDVMTLTLTLDDVEELMDVLGKIASALKQSSATSKE